MKKQILLLWLATLTNHSFCNFGIPNTYAELFGENISLSNNSNIDLAFRLLMLKNCVHNAYDACESTTKENYQYAAYHSCASIASLITSITYPTPNNWYLYKHMYNKKHSDQISGIALITILSCANATYKHVQIPGYEAIPRGAICAKAFWECFSFLLVKAIW
jgi:hypothetical protein